MLAFSFCVTGMILLYAVVLNVFLYIKRKNVEVQKRENIPYCCGIFHPTENRCLFHYVKVCQRIYEGIILTFNIHMYTRN